MVWWRTLPAIFFYTSNWVDDFLLAIMKGGRGEGKKSQDTLVCLGDISYRETESKP